MTTEPLERTGEDVPEPSSKVDPETLELRGRPPGVARFRRGLVVGVAGFGAAALVAVAWFALDPPSLASATVDEGDRLETGKPGDALSALPGSYGEVPKLGPPLPGDLGRPILSQAREDGLAPVAPAYEQPESESVRLLRERREREAELRRAARSSAVLVRASPSRLGGGPKDDGLESSDASQARRAFGLDEDAKRQRIGFTANGPAASPHRLEEPASPYVLSAGSVIPASLITGISSDFPGLVTAQVTERIYDSPTGQTLLIPQGARLLGTYDSEVAYGQRRALVVWQRLVMPNGASLTIDNVPATDAAGYSGLRDGVDHHTWALLKGVAISTLLGVGANLSISGESDLVRAVRESVQQGGARVGDQVVAKGLDIQPTITIRPGARVRLLVHRDLVLRPWQG